MTSDLENEEDLEQLEDAVVQEIIEYCADCGTPPTAEVMAETIEARREKSGPGRIQRLYTEVEARVRRRLQL